MQERNNDKATLYKLLRGGKLQNVNMKTRIKNLHFSTTLKLLFSENKNKKGNSEFFFLKLQNDAPKSYLHEDGKKDRNPLQKIFSRPNI